jgi:ankyrin repeat protein
MRHLADDPNARDALHRPADRSQALDPRHAAAEVLQRLLSIGSDLLARNDRGRTPLYWAVLGGQIETVKWLVSLGAAQADPLRERRDWSLLAAAASRGHLPVVESLLEQVPTSRQSPTTAGRRSAAVLGRRPEQIRYRSGSSGGCSRPAPRSRRSCRLNATTRARSSAGDGSPRTRRAPGLATASRSPRPPMPGRFLPVLAGPWTVSA